MRLGVAVAVVSLSIIGLAVADDVRASVRRPTNIPAQGLGPALQALAKDRNFQVVYVSEEVANVRTQGAVGEFTSEEALRQLLRGTRLSYRYLDEKTITILPTSTTSNPGTVPTSPDNAPGSNSSGDTQQEGKRSSSAGFRLAQVDQGQTSSPSTVKKQDEQASKKKPVQLEEMRVTLPEVLVIGSKSLNMDIERSVDDAQPYVIYERETIERSGAANVEEFLKQRLTMNAVADTPSQSPGAFGNMSQINLRGLGTNQTLILIDGHRAASPVTTAGTGAPTQADLNGIPLAAIERIEVLSTTASGIYGGSATGGVVNIVLRHDYSGAEMKVTYGDTFSAHAATRRVDVSAGTNVENGKTNVMLAASWSDGDVLTVRDRDFVQRGRTTILANNAAFILDNNNPPLGSTPNIGSADGSPLFGPGTPNITFVPVGYAGNGGLAPLQVNAGKYNLNLANTAQSGGGGKLGLTNAPTVESLNATIRRQFTPSLAVFLDLAASNNNSQFLNSTGFSGTYFLPAAAPNNPFGKDVLVTVPLPQADSLFSVRNFERRLVGGAIQRLPHDWSIEADYTWDRSSFAYSNSAGFLTGDEGTAIANGALDVLRDVNAFPLNLTPYFSSPLKSSAIKSTLKDATLRLAGPVASLPAGSLMVAALLEHRDELFGEAVVVFPPFGGTVYPDRSQSVDSVYAEARFPLVSTKNKLRGVEELELQLAARHDSYSVKGATNSIDLGSTTPIVRPEDKLNSTDPTLGLRYQPVRDMTLRASYGTGFLPPNVAQLVTNLPPLNVPAGIATDPLRGNTPTGPFQLLIGGNPNANPEKSKSRSFGAILTPRWVSGLRLSVDYTRIEKTDNLIIPSVQDVINNEAILPGRIVRGPVPAGDPFGVGPITRVDRTILNIASAKVEAYDTALDYHRQTARVGTFDFFALATWQPHYQTQLAPSQPIVENAGVQGSSGAVLFGIPVKLRANGGVTWGLRQWTLAWTARYFDSYVVSRNPTFVLNQGSQRVPSQVYHDLFAAYRFNRFASMSVLDNTEIQLAIKDVFNTKPPLDMGSNLGYFYSPFGDPRLASYSFSIKKSF